MKVAMAQLFGSGKIERTSIAMAMARLLGGAKSHIVTKSKRYMKLGQN